MNVGTLLVGFLPAILYWPVWIYAMTTKEVWRESFSEFYPMSLCMILGCFIAGSTPIGGAVMAFPVSVLILKFTPAQGRDFAAFIQSVGMTAATYLIFVRKRHMVNLDMLIISCFGGTVGVLLGIDMDLAPFWVNVTYMVYTLAFACILLYTHMRTSGGTVTVRGTVAAQSLEVNKEGSQWIKDDSVPKTTLLLLHFGLFVVGICGGALTSKTGSGSDTVAFVYGVFGYNLVLSKPITEASLTITSVCIMGYMTVVVAAIRQLQGDVHRNVYLCWGAVSWIVVAGAPFGSLVLNEQRQVHFRRLFYVLALVQFISFAVFKVEGVGAKIPTPPGNRRDAWLVIGAVMGASLCLIAGHYACSTKLHRAETLPGKGEVEPTPVDTAEATKDSTV